ncbi:nicotinate (nicotinamide) nucleotide adenylyltransferase [Granulicella arctica]|uniref:nicotinate (nicotinamide) nucleotide adenylyltransferase n=1 Tax=Granulicella arctica TaxID=940613 RepID=UPI0021E00B9D|nr:nicotinate (nicotinamide) nucleotide adenylyltransferase [Granulicella arctica]
MRVAFFGGSFDPVHRGHLAVATAAANHFSLDTVLFAPTGRQPLKPSGATASFEDRLAMVTLACTADARFSPCALDAPRIDGKPNYSIDVLTALGAQMPEAKLFNLVGIDSFLGLPRWHEAERLMALVEWIIVSRPGFTLDSASLSLSQRARIHPLDSVHEDVAATHLRPRLKLGDPCLDLIPTSVSSYIAAHHLYR